MSSTTSSPTRSHAPKRSISHKATSFFNRVKDADLAIVEAGQKLASELHHIFVSSPSQEISEPTEAMLTKLAPFGNNEVNLSTPRPSSSLGDLTFLPFQNPCPSSEPCSVATTPLLSPSSLTPRSSCESIRNWKFESLSDIPPLVPPETPEEIPDPWHARPNVDYEAEERRLLCLESARSVFGWTRPAISASPIVDSKHKRSVSAAASSPLSYMSYPEDFSPSAADNDDLELGAVMQNERKRRRRLSRSHSRFNLSSNRPLRVSLRRSLTLSSLLTLLCHSHRWLSHPSTSQFNHSPLLHLNPRLRIQLRCLLLHSPGRSLPFVKEPLV
ncbi:hypothetical protein FRC03_008790 [Tulasnella sp. 419]|nr:hypothetical protein FRC03_008790 [Tulasnella sp. 419]